MNHASPRSHAVRADARYIQDRSPRAPTQEADVGVRSFYNYFRSKDELLAVSGLDVSPRFFAALRDRCGSVAFAGA